MKILILSQNYPPEPVPKPHMMAVGLQRRGHQVGVLTGFPNYPDGVLYSGYKLRPWLREVIDGVTVVRVPVFPDHSRSAFRRTLNHGSFALAAVILGAFLVGRPDIIIAHQPPTTTGVAAWVLALCWRIPFLYEVNDLWPEGIALAGFVRNGRVLKLIEQLESFVSNRAAVVTVLTSSFATKLIERKVPGERIRLLRDWADGTIYRPLRPDPLLAQELGMAGRFNVMFAGYMGILQALDSVLEAAQRLDDFPAIQFVFVGDGLDKSRLQALSRERGIKNVRFLDREPAQRMPRLYALADVLLAHLTRKPGAGYWLPSKVSAYLACGRPLLLAIGEQGAELIEQSGAGLACPAEDPEALAQAVRRLYLMAPAERARMGTEAREAFRRMFDPKTHLDRLEGMLEEALRMSPGGRLERRGQV